MNFPQVSVDLIEHGRYDLTVRTVRKQLIPEKTAVTRAGEKPLHREEGQADELCMETEELKGDEASV